jgi:FkbM family methyltransferase
MLRIIPKTTKINFGNLSATFFVPIYNHYICEDLTDMKLAKREPYLYKWLNDIKDGSVFFDIGTSYGQEVCLLSSAKDIKVYGFDCGLNESHFCALNKKINNDRFTFTFAVIGKKSGDIVTLETNSSTHISRLHKKNVPYSYQAITLSLDDFAQRNKVMPTHIKIDVDGSEFDVLEGAKKIISSQVIKEIFIEVDKSKTEIIEMLDYYGFKIKWKIEKDLNYDILFTK